MNLNKRYGIILRTYKPRKYKLSLFDEHLGRIECIVPVKKRAFFDKAANGALLYYYIKPLQTVYELHEIEIIDLPSAYARHDIYFLHHILELYYYFIPSDLPSIELFDLLKLLFAPSSYLYTKHGKKMFVLKFLSVLGVFPEETVSFSPEMYRLISLSIDGMLKRTLDAHLEKEIENLICASIGAHPYKKQFKTTYFISRTDYDDSEKR